MLPSPAGSDRAASCGVLLVRTSSRPRCGQAFWGPASRLCLRVETAWQFKAK